MAAACSGLARPPFLVGNRKDARGKRLRGYLCRANDRGAEERLHLSAAHCRPALVFVLSEFLLVDVVADGVDGDANFRGGNGNREQLGMDNSPLQMLTNFSQIMQICQSLQGKMQKNQEKVSIPPPMHPDSRCYTRKAEINPFSQKVGYTGNAL